MKNQTPVSVCEFFQMRNWELYFSLRVLIEILDLFMQSLLDYW